MEQSKESGYIKLLLGHAAIGGVAFVFPVLMKVYSILIFLYGVYFIYKHQNKNNEALVISAYVVGMEVLLRMTNGMHFNEYAKYSIIIYMILGMIYSGMSLKSFVYILFLLFLIPGVVLSTVTLSFEANIRKAIAFNISGPVCLGISALYCYSRQISWSRFKTILSAFGLPLVAIVVYLFLYTPSIKDVVTDTQSNFETSGGFGPNQMSTILGFGIFIFFAQLLLNSPTNKLRLLHASLAMVFAFRGIVTFSRGGVITGVVMIVLLLGILFLYSRPNVKMRIAVIFAFSLFAALGVWTYSSLQTGGLIENRYANKDARGREKASKLTGREQLIESELKMFMDNPILGIGVGKNKEYREETTGIQAASHNEITRMLAEHGMFGAFNLMILVVTPLILAFNNRMNFFVLPFVAFWLLTINHASMRLAAPAFVYALALLKVRFENENTVPRESAQ